MLRRKAMHTFDVLSGLYRPRKVTSTAAPDGVPFKGGNHTTQESVPPEKNTHQFPLVPICRGYIEFGKKAKDFSPVPECIGWIQALRATGTVVHRHEA